MILYTCLLLFILHILMLYIYIACQPLCLMLLLLVHRYRALPDRGGDDRGGSDGSVWWPPRLLYGQCCLAVSTPCSRAFMLFWLVSSFGSFYSFIFWLGPWGSLMFYIILLLNLQTWTLVFTFQHLLLTLHLEIPLVFMKLPLLFCVFKEMFVPYSGLRSISYMSEAMLYLFNVGNS